LLRFARNDEETKKAGLSIRPFCIWDVSFARFFSVAI